MRLYPLVIMVPSFTIGGAENMVFQICTQLYRNFDVTIIVLANKKNTYYEDVLEQLPIKIYYIGSEGRVRIKTFIKYWRILRENKPVIIHTHLHTSIYAIPWIISHNIKGIHTIHSTPEFEFSNTIKRLMKLCYKFKKIIPVAISNEIHSLTAELYKLNTKNIELINNPVQCNKFYSNLVKEDFVFINVARLNANKNQTLLINAFNEVNNKYPSTKLLILGDGEMRDSLNTLVEKLNLTDKVIFTGNVENIEDYLAISSVFVLTSFYEGLPLSILEAMASGLPIISTNVGGIKDIVEDNGVLIDNYNKKDLIEAMLTVLEDNELREKMSKLSKLKSQDYDIEIIANKYKELYFKYL